MHSLDDFNRDKGFRLGYGQRISNRRQSPRLLAGLLLVLVVLLHTWLADWLLQPHSQPAKRKPVMIEVSLLPAPTRKTLTSVTAAPAKPAPTPKKPRYVKRKAGNAKPLAKPPARKKIAEKKTPSTHKPLPEPIPPLPQQPAGDEITSKAESSKPAPAVASNAKKTVRATCVRCPNPKYPSIARRRGWQGSVLLKFQMTPEGLARNIKVDHSSGHELLDEAAIASIKESRFTAGEPGVIRTATRLFNFKLN